MPVRAWWHDDAHTIIHYEFADTWTVDEYFDTSVEVQQMMDSVEHIVHAIAVFKAKTIPDDILTRLPEVNRSAPFSHPRLGAGVVVATNPLARSITRIYGMVYKPLPLVRTIEEAEQIIKGQNNQHE
jgi:hypothetical protein